MTDFIQQNLNSIILGDCLDVMRNIPDKSIDLVLTDPPYPDYYAEEYSYNETPIRYLENFSCKQLIFWTSKEDFLIDHTAIHIWDKKCGAGSQYERIFERNGGKEYKVFRHYLINSTVAAKMTRDTFYNHPSQKPINLIKELIEKYSKEGQTILDPFTGSGTTAIACHDLKRNFICIEKEPEYHAIATKRYNEAKAQMRLF